MKKKISTLAIVYLTKLKLALSLILLLFVGCQLDDRTEIPLIRGTQRMVVSQQEIPNVTDVLLEKLGLSSGSNGFSINDGVDGGNLNIDWQKILQLVDSTGKETYTFGIKDNDGKLSSFYNLILQFDEFGVAQAPFILKYEMDDSFTELFKRTGTLEGFTGSVQKIVLNDFSFPSRNSANQGSNLGGQPCPSTTTVSGGSSNHNGGGDLPSDETVSWICEVFVITTTWTSTACAGNICDDPITYQEQSLVTECTIFSDLEASGVSNANCNLGDDEFPMIPPSSRCDSDPLAIMEISDFNLDRNSNRFGCVRLGATTCNGKKWHEGIDLQANIGTQVYAMYGGSVVASSTEYTQDGELITGWGHWIMIQSVINGITYYTVYAHLREVPDVAGTVSAGSAIGFTGDSGNAAGEPHLHIEMRRPTTSGQSFNSSPLVDPENFLGATFDEHGNTNYDVTCDYGGGL